MRKLDIYMSNALAAISVVVLVAMAAIFTRAMLKVYGEAHQKDDAAEAAHEGEVRDAE